MSQGIATLPRTASRQGYRLAAQVLFLVFVGGMVAASRRYVDLHLGVPGHTGVLWMFLMVLGYGAVKRPGAGLVMGCSAALWGEVFGLSHGLPYNLLLYGAPGLTMDVAARLFRSDLAHPLASTVAGAAAHSAKYLFVVAYAMALGLPANLLTMGIARGLGYHVLFGAVGGLLGGLALRWGRSYLRHSAH